MWRQAPTCRPTVNLKLRLEERLRRQLEREARKADRSMNAEIIDRLEKSFVEPALLERIGAAVKSDNDEIARRLAGLESTLNKLSSTLHGPPGKMPQVPLWPPPLSSWKKQKK
jgi:hypothetical protein